jgi:cation transport ATPase
VTSDPSDRIRKLTEYFADNQASMTHEALGRQASAKGYSEDEIEAASAAAEARRAPDAAARSRAKRVILGLYLVTYLVLTAGMLLSSQLYGLAPIAAIILAGVLALALAISLAWIRRRHLDAGHDGAMATLVALPLVLLVGVAGLCLYTTGPYLFRGA